MSRAGGRTQLCGAAEARTRLNDARAQLEFAELATAASTSEERKAAVSCAVVAGIAASDAACCAALGQRSRSQNHRDAADLVRSIAPGGDDAAKLLGRLLGLKDAAQYGFDAISGPALVGAQRQARQLVEFAERIVNR
jgi:hypothetical protein